MDMDTEFNNHISCPASCLRKLLKTDLGEPEAEVGDKNGSRQCVRTINVAVRIRQVVNLRETNHYPSENLEVHPGGQLET